MDKIYLCDLTYTQQSISSDVMPAAIGGLASYLKHNLQTPIDLKLFKYPEAFIEELENHCGETTPKVVGFSNYSWNANLSLQFARLVKKHFPDCVIVFGGPNLPFDSAEQEQFMRSNTAIDFHIVKEGERAFYLLVKKLIENNYDQSVIDTKIPNLIYIDKHDVFQASPVIDRVPIEDIPSPYLMGLMDVFFDGKLGPIIQTARGCPFTCTFCTEGMKHWTKIYKNVQEKIDAEVVYIAKKMNALGSRGRGDLFIADSNFGMYDQDKQTAIALAKTQDEYQYPKYINVTTGKNRKEKVLEVASIVRGAMKLSGSIQSSNPQVLKEIKRSNIKLEELVDVAVAANEIGANTTCELILGLPGDSRTAHFDSLKSVVETGFNHICMFQLMILPSTEMGSLESRDRYKIHCEYRVIPRCYGHYEAFGESLPAAEVEEICVSNKTLSFEDYLACRKMNLLVHIFYNDGVFKDLLKLVRSLELSPWDWLEAIYSHPSLPKKFNALLEEFLLETRSELWKDQNKLLNFYNEKANIEKLVGGEAGSNLIFKYKSLALTQDLQETSSVALESFYQLLKKNQLDEENLRQFGREVIDFNTYMIKDIFSAPQKPLTAEFQYDIDRYSNDKMVASLESYHLPEKNLLRFEATEEQIKGINNYIQIFGNNANGISRILTRSYLSKWKRHVTILPNTQRKKSA